MFNLSLDGQLEEHLHKRRFLLRIYRWTRAVGLFALLFFTIFALPFLQYGLVYQTRTVFLALLFILALFEVTWLWRKVNYGLFVWLMLVMVLVAWGMWRGSFEVFWGEMAYAYIKIMRFGIMWIVNALLFYWAGRKYPRLLWRLFILASASYLLLLLWLYGLSAGDRILLVYKYIRGMGTTYLSFGRLSGLTATLLCVVFIGISQDGLQSNIKFGKVFWQVVLFGALIFDLYILYILDSKGPLLATLAILGAILIEQTKKEVRVGLFALGIGVLSFLFLLLLNVSPWWWKAATNASIQSRLERYRVALEMMADEPWVGQGPGAFVLEYQRTCPLCTINAAKEYPHNLLLEVGAELGGLGLIIMMFMLFLPLGHYFSIQMKARTFSLGRFSGILWLYIYTLLIAQTSSDLAGNYWIAIFAGWLFSFRVPVDADAMATT